MTNSELKEKLTGAIALLKIPGVGRISYQKLLKKFGSPEGVFEASIDEISMLDRISRGMASGIKREGDLKEAGRIASKIVQLGWQVMFLGDENYPEQLNNIPAPPPLLFATGQELGTDEKLIAIVGTRHATEAGELFTYKLASELASEGITVVSGMAEGIDSAAHKGALDAGGKTIAVWGSSLDIVFPASNRKLAEKIKKQGTVYSEYLPETRPDKAFFPERNRIISGLSSGIVVVEAGEKSGALITAGHALEQGKEIFAVPGGPAAAKSQGVNELIKKGARLLTSVQDIFEELPLLKNQILVKKLRRLPDMTDTEQKIVGLFTEGPKQIDQISREVKLPIGELAEFMLTMELRGIIRELPGKRFVLSEDFQ